MTAPDPLAVRAYHAAVKRHRDAAVREAAHLKTIVDRIVTDLAADGTAHTSDGRRALHTAGMLHEMLTALEVLRQDALHLTIAPDAEEKTGG